jgi:G3E family GTPase
LQQQAASSKIPVTLVTGFLGSGKTTLIAQLLTHPDMSRVAVVVNEVGEIGIDHDLITFSSENISLLANGCICCSVRTDLQETLRDLFAQKRAGQVFDFDRVVVETTGLADPAPVMQTLFSDTLLEAQFRLDGVLTLVDSVLGPHTIQTHPEALKQVLMADALLLSKCDLSTAEQQASCRSVLAELRPGLSVQAITQGQIDPQALLGFGLQRQRNTEQLQRFFGQDLLAAQDQPESALAQQWRSQHTPFSTHTLRFDKPFTWAAFTEALELLARLRGADLLRMKGIVNVEGAPLLVQGVQHLFQSPVTLERWPSDDHQSRLVFITRGIERAALVQVFKAIDLLMMARPDSTVEAATALAKESL